MRRREYASCLQVFRFENVAVLKHYVKIVGWNERFTLRGVLRTLLELFVQWFSTQMSTKWVHIEKIALSWWLAGGTYDLNEMTLIRTVYIRRCDTKYLRKFMRYRVSLLRIGKTLGIE